MVLPWILLLGFVAGLLVLLVTTAAADRRIDRRIDNHGVAPRLIDPEEFAWFCRLCAEQGVETAVHTIRLRSSLAELVWRSFPEETRRRAEADRIRQDKKFPGWMEGMSAWERDLWEDVWDQG